MVFDIWPSNSVITIRQKLNNLISIQSFICVKKYVSLCIQRVQHTLSTYTANIYQQMAGIQRRV